MPPFMEHLGGQSPKVLASTKGARVIFYGTSRRLLTTVLRKVSTRTWRLPSSLSFVVTYTSFDRPAKQLSSWCVRLTGRWVNRRSESKSRPLPACRGLSPTTVPAPSTASSTARSRQSRYVNNDAFGQAFV